MGERESGGSSLSRKELEKAVRKNSGCSVKELEKELEHAEKALKEKPDDFPGAEERMLRKLMEREERAEGDAGKKARRRGGRRTLAIGALAAVFVMGLGMSAIGGKKYSFCRTVGEGGRMVVDNDENTIDKGGLNEACAKIEKEFGTEIKKIIEKMCFFD